MELIVGHYQKNYRTVKFTLRSRSKHLPLVKTLRNGIKESDREGFGRIGSREREREREEREKKAACASTRTDRANKQSNSAEKIKMEKQKWRRGKREKKKKRERREKEGEKKCKKRREKKKRKGGEHQRVKCLPLRRTYGYRALAAIFGTRITMVVVVAVVVVVVENRRGARERGLKTGRGSAKNSRGGRERGGIREKSNDNNYRENGISRWARDAWRRAGWGTDQPDVIPGRVVCTEWEEEGHEGTREMERSARRERENRRKTDP